MKLKIFIVLLSFANICPNSDGAPRFDPSKSKGKQLTEHEDTSSDNETTAPTPNTESVPTTTHNTNEEETEPEDEGLSIKLGRNINKGKLQEIGDYKIGFTLQDLINQARKKKGHLRLDIANSMNYGEKQKIGSLQMGNTIARNVPSDLQTGTSSHTPRESSISEITSTSSVRSDRDKQDISSDSAVEASTSENSASSVRRDTNKQRTGSSSSRKTKKKRSRGSRKQKE